MGISTPLESFKVFENVIFDCRLTEKKSIINKHKSLIYISKKQNVITNTKDTQKLNVIRLDSNIFITIKNYFNIDFIFF